jgi:hypothetical protein
MQTRNPSVETTNPRIAATFDRNARTISQAVVDGDIRRARRAYAVSRGLLGTLPPAPRTDDAQTWIAVARLLTAKAERIRLAHLTREMVTS